MVSRRIRASLWCTNHTARVLDTAAKSRSSEKCARHDACGVPCVSRSISAACLLGLLFSASCHLDIFGDDDSDCSDPAPAPTQPENVQKSLAESAKSLPFTAASNGGVMTLSLAVPPPGGDACETFDLSATLNGKPMTSHSQGALFVQGQCYGGSECCAPSSYTCEGPDFTAPFDSSLVPNGQWNFVISDSSGSFEVDLTSPDLTVSIDGSSTFTSGEGISLQIASTTDAGVPASSSIFGLALSTDSGAVIANLPLSLTTYASPVQAELPAFGTDAQLGGALVPCDVAIDHLPCTAVLTGSIDPPISDAGVSRCDFESCASGAPAFFALPIVLAFSDAGDAGSTDADVLDASDAGD